MYKHCVCNRYKTHWYGKLSATEWFNFTVEMKFNFTFLTVEQVYLTNDMVELLHWQKRLITERNNICHDVNGVNSFKLKEKYQVEFQLIIISM